MKPSVLTALFLAMFSLSLSAQTTATVTGTLVDDDNQIWGSATSLHRQYTAKLIRNNTVMDAMVLGENGYFELQDKTLGADESEALAERFEVFPNPFSGSLTLALHTQTSLNNLQLTIRSSAGNLVFQQAIAKKAPGTHYFKWDAHSAAEGLYVVQLTAHKPQGHTPQRWVRKVVKSASGAVAVPGGRKSATSTARAYTLEFSGPGMDTTRHQVELTAGETTYAGQMVAEELVEEVTLTGEVVNQHGEPLDQATATLRLGNDTVAQQYITDGSYTLMAPTGGNDYNRPTGYTLGIDGYHVADTMLYNLVFTGDSLVNHMQLHVEVVGPVTIEGFVYDLDNKYDDNWQRVQPPGLANMIVFLKSKGIESHVRTNENGRFSMTFDSLTGFYATENMPHPVYPAVDYLIQVTDTLVVAGTETDLSDTTYYLFKTPVNKIVKTRVNENPVDSTYVNKIQAGEINEITAFNDTTGIPQIKREYYEETGRDLIEYMQEVTDIANKHKNDPVWEHTSPRTRDADLPIKVYLNTEEDPTDKVIWQNK